MKPTSFALTPFRTCLLSSVVLLGTPLQAILSAQGSQPQEAASATPTANDWRKPGEVIAALNLKPGQVVADLGAGSGYFTHRFAMAVGPTGKAIGLDVEASIVERLAQDAKSRGLSNYETRLIPFDNPGLGPGSTDVIFLSNAYHHIGDRVAYFARVRPALRPGGRLVILDFDHEALAADPNHKQAHDPAKHEAHAASPSHKHEASAEPEEHLSKKEVLSELERAGYRLTKEFTFLPRQFFLVFESAS